MIYAFPSMKEQTERGMRLRDYFAAAALQGEFAAQHDEESVWQEGSFAFLAKRCYAAADAMIEERNRSESP